MLPLREATEEFERQIVTRVLERVRWNQSEAARILGLHRNVLKTKLARWGLLATGRDDPMRRDPS
jgi:two-component system NtrC family response regulator